MPELPKHLEDEFRRLAETPGDADIFPADDSTAEPETASVQDPSEATAEQLPVRQPQPRKPQPGTPNAGQNARAANQKPAVNLDDYEEFRRYKAERDRKESELQRKLAEHEAQLTARQQAEEQARIDAINERLGEVPDDYERARLLDEAAALRGRAYYEQWQRWEQYKGQRIAEEGVDANDARFQKQYSGEQGALEFERDLLTAAKEKHQREAAELRAAASPQAIQDLIRKELAKQAQGLGLNYADTGEGTPEAVGDVERAMDDFNLGRISFQEFQRRTNTRR